MGFNSAFKGLIGTHKYTVWLNAEFLIDTEDITHTTSYRRTSNG